MSVSACNVLINVLDYFNQRWSRGRANLKKEAPMTTFSTPSDLTFDMADRIAAALKTAGIAMVETGLSNRSCSAYVTFAGADDSEHCIRISDHEARSYNRDGDFRIGIGSNGDDHVSVDLRACFERSIVKAVAWDKYGEPVEYETAGCEPCHEDDDDAEFAHWEADEDAIVGAVAAAVEFASRKVTA